MRKVLLSMLVLALAVPAFAAEIALVDNEDGTVSITIDSAEAVRGLALKVTLTDGATLVDPDGAAVNEAFNTFIDYAFEMEAVQPGQFDIGDGHPFALVNEPGTVGAGATEFSISMGVLDQTGEQAGFQTTGAEVLITFQTGAGVVTVGLDTLRGGIVGDVALDSNLDDADIQITVTDDGVVDPCRAHLASVAPGLLADYDAYAAAGQDARVWCWQYNCRGDATNSTTGFPFNYRVGVPDLNIFLANWQKTLAGGADPRVDFTRSSTGFPFNYRVGVPDLNIFLANWQKTDAQLEPCPTYLP